MEGRVEEGIFDTGSHISLAWSWILETLAEVKEVDIPLLKAIASRVPGFEKDLFRNARERISWRCLDELLHSRSDCVQCKLPTLSSDGAGTSRSCEDLLLRLSREATRLTDRKKLLRQLKHDHQFLCHKKICFSKPPLLKLKDAIPVHHHVSPSPNSKRTLDKGGRSHTQSMNFKTVSADTNEHRPSKRSMTRLASDDILALNETDAAPIQHVGIDIPSSGEQSNQQNQCTVRKETLMGGKADGNDDTVVLPNESILPSKIPTSLIKEPTPDGFHGNVLVHQRSNGGDAVIPEIPTSTGDFSDKAADLSQYIDTKEDQLGGRGLPGSQSIDPVETLCTEQGLCIKCNEGGNLLSCDGIGCPILVHESCLGSSLRFDDEDNFYCPYCAYRLAAAAYRKAKEKALLARKALSSFMGTDGGNWRTRKISLLKEERHPTQEEASCGDSVQHRDDHQQGATVNNHNGGKSPCEDVASGEHKEVASDSQTGETEGVQLSNHREGLHYVERMAVNHLENLTTDDESLSNKVEISHGVVSKHCSDSPFSRQKKPAWTKEEDEALKEGVKRFPVEGRGIPWSKILEHGLGAFHKTRAPVDLKDRWRKLKGK